MKRMITGLLVAVCFVLPAAGYSAQARGAALYDCLTGSFLWEQNGTAPMGMVGQPRPLVHHLLSAGEHHTVQDWVHLGHHSPLILNFSYFRCMSPYPILERRF